MNKTRQKTSREGPASQLAEDHNEEELDTRRRVRALVLQYNDFVWRSLRRIGLPRCDCDDGCQRVWLVVVRRIADIDPERTRSFLFSVAIRVASEMKRSASRHQHQALHELGESSSLEGPNSALSVESSFERRQAQRLLDELLSEMSLELRIVFVLFEVEGFSSVEIANLVGVSRGTVASRLRLAREQLRRGMARYRLRFSGVRRRDEGRDTSEEAS